MLYPKKITKERIMVFKKAMCIILACCVALAVKLFWAFDGKHAIERHAVQVGVPGKSQTSSTAPEHRSSLDAEEAVTLSRPWEVGKATSAQDYPYEIHIGDNIDPDAPSFFQEQGEEVHIGSPVDPDEPLTVPGNEVPKIIHIGLPFDPDDEYAWESPASASIHIGLPIGYELHDSSEEEHIHIGETMHSSEIE